MIETWPLTIILVRRPGGMKYFPLPEDDIMSMGYVDAITLHLNVDEKSGRKSYVRLGSRD